MHTLYHTYIHIHTTWDIHELYINSTIQDNWYTYIHTYMLYTIAMQCINRRVNDKRKKWFLTFVRFFTSGLSIRAFIFRVVDFIKQKIWEVLWSNSVTLKPDVEWSNMWISDYKRITMRYSKQKHRFRCYFSARIRNITSSHSSFNIEIPSYSSYDSLI